MFNRAALGVYEMGSVFKIFTVAMALDSGTARLDSGYDASAPLKVSRFTIRDYHGKNRWLTVAEIFQHSSNIGAARMALDVGGAGQRAFLKKLGLLSAAPIELPEVGLPLAPDPWREINTMTIGFGHGVSVTPVQMAAAAAAVVNGGVYYRPTLARRADNDPPAGRRVISARTSAEMRELMRLVVASGTGKQADAPGYRVGGKTGTAEKAHGGGYRTNALVSTFVAAFPMDDPRYVVLIMLDEPRGDAGTGGAATAGWTAAPVVSEVISRIGPLLGIMPDEHRDIDTAALRAMLWRPRSEREG
jgi:cell division protein FtsI (penicillin-binding protein 3)